MAGLAIFLPPPVSRQQLSRFKTRRIQFFLRTIPDSSCSLHPILFPLCSFPPGDDGRVRYDVGVLFPQCMLDISLFFFYEFGWITAVWVLMDATPTMSQWDTEIRSTYREHCVLETDEHTCLAGSPLTNGSSKLHFFSNILNIGVLLSFVEMGYPPSRLVFCHSNGHDLYDVGVPFIFWGNPKKTRDATPFSPPSGPFGNDNPHVSMHELTPSILVRYFSVCWFGTWFFWISICWQFHHPNWLSYFSEG